MTLYEDFPRFVREYVTKWFEPSLVEHLMDGLRKAGLDLREAGGD